MDLVVEFRLDVDGGIRDEQRARVGWGVHDEHVGDPATGAQAGVGLHRGLEQFVGVQAAFHESLEVAAAALDDTEFSGLALGVGLEDRVLADIDANPVCESLHGLLVTDQCGLNQSGCCGLYCALESHFRLRPHDCGGNGRERLAALEKFMKDVIVSGMADQGVDGYGFGKGGKIAHLCSSPSPTLGNLSALTNSLSTRQEYVPVRVVTVRAGVSYRGMD